MKNFKKVLALVLAFAMVLSSLTAFAAETAKNEAAAKALYQLGLFQGTSADEFVPNLEGTLTKGDALKLMSSAFGWDLDSAVDTEITFEDVKSWQVPAVKYAVANGILTGNSAKEMGQKLNARLLLTLVLRQLGYETAVAYEKADDLAFAEELISPKDYYAASDSANRDLGVGVFFETLKKTRQDADVTVIEELVNAGKVDEAKAIALELIPEPVVEDFAVESVEGLNLVQTLVTFNSKLNKDTVKADNFVINGKKADKVVVQDDQMSVVAIHATGTKVVDNGSTVKVKVSEVKDTDGNKMTKVTEQVKYYDNTLPELISVEVTGEKNVRLLFNEPMKVETSDKDAFKFTKENGQKVYVRSVKSNPNDINAVDVTLSAILKEETYNVTVNAKLTDFALFGIVAQESFEVVKDEEAPYVVDFKDATEDGVTLIFNEDIQVISGKQANYYHTNDKNTIAEDLDTTDTDTASVKGKELTLKFTKYSGDTLVASKSSKLTDGTNYIHIKEKVLKDKWGNKIEHIRFAIEVKEDVEAPVVTEVKQGGANNKIEVKLDKSDLKKSVAEDEKNYTLVDGDGDKVAISKATWNADDKVVTLKLKKDFAGELTLTIENYEDIKGNDMDSESFDLVMSDGEAPKYPENVAGKRPIRYEMKDGTTVSEYVLAFRYTDDGEMLQDDSQYSVTNADNYRIKVETIGYKYLSDFSDYSIDVSEDGKAVYITLPASALKKDGATKEPRSITVARVADAEGNKTDALSSGELTFENGANVKVKEVKAINKDTIEVVFKSEVENPVEEDFVIVYEQTSAQTDTDGKITNKVNVGSSEYKVNADGETVVTLSLEDSLTYDGKFIARNEDGDPTGDTHSIYFTLKPSDKIESTTKFNMKIELDGAFADVEDKIKAAFDKDKTVAGIKTSKVADKDTAVLRYDDIYKTTGATATTQAVVTLDFTEALKGNDDVTSVTAREELLRAAFVVNYSEADKALINGKDYTVDDSKLADGKVTFTIKFADVAKLDKINGTYTISLTDSPYLLDAKNNRVENFDFSFEIDAEKP